MYVTDETKQIAQDILDFFIEHPEMHDQEDVWGEVVPGGDLVTVLSPQEDICGTTLCVAGAAVFLKYGLSGLNNLLNLLWINWEGVGGEILGLSPMEAGTLFYTREEDVAIDMVRAIANGDVDKFQSFVN